MTATLRHAMVGLEARMSTTPSKSRRDTLNVRIKPSDRSLIDQAARLAGKTRTDFVLEAARRAAEDTVLDRTLFIAGPDAFVAFQARLDAPPRQDDKLRRTLLTASAWD
jgi:uncharacterized protein (DUF1778 family)